MKPEDFYQFESGLSQKAATKESKPLLADVYVAEFRRDELLMFFKKDPESAEFNSTDFLKNKPMKLMAEKKYFSQIKSKSRSGIPASRKTGIIEKLCSMMPASRREFWKSLPTSDWTDFIFVISVITVISLSIFILFLNTVSMLNDWNILYLLFWKKDVSVYVFWKKGVSAMLFQKRA